METYFILMENIANYLFSSLLIGVSVWGGGMFNL
jgi:hypothetical protein